LTSVPLARNDAQTTLDHAESWSAHATLVIFAGIIIEIVSLFVFPHYSSAWEKWLLVLGDVAIGIGLIIEYFCILWTIRASGELKAQSDAKLTEALNRAANAESALVKFRTPRRELMTPKARTTSAARLRPFAGTQFDVGFGNGDGEQADFIWDLEEVLATVGWTQLGWGVHAQGAIVINRNLRPLAASVGAQNVEVQIEPTHRLVKLAAVQALVDALTEIGIEARETTYNSVSTNAQAIHILVGPKR
jgi:hypothetical protein